MFSVETTDLVQIEEGIAIMRVSTLTLKLWQQLCSRVTDACYVDRSIRQVLRSLSAPALSQDFDLHPLAGPHSEVESISSPPGPYPIFPRSSKTIFQCFLDVTGFVLYCIRTLLPPL